MLTILEGPNCAGKTTLARQLAVILKAHHVHTVSFPELAHTAGLYVERLKHYAGKRVILDRWTPSELAYAKVRHGHRGDRLSLLGWRITERLTWSQGPVIVIMLPEEHVLRDRWRQSDRHGLTTDQLLGVTKIYRERPEPFPAWPGVIYDPSVDRLDGLLSELTNLRPRKPEPGFEGCPGADFNVVVENPHSLDLRSLGAATTMMMAVLGVPERKLIWSPPEMIALKGYTRIAVGQAAIEACRERRDDFYAAATPDDLPLVMEEIENDSIIHAARTPNFSGRWPINVRMRQRVRPLK